MEASQWLQRMWLHFPFKSVSIPWASIICTGGWSSICWIWRPLNFLENSQNGLLLFTLRYYLFLTSLTIKTLHSSSRPIDSLVLSFYSSRCELQKQQNPRWKKTTEPGRLRVPLSLWEIPDFTKIYDSVYSRTWNVRSMNQGKLEVVKQEMARVNVDILGISELKWSGMGEFNSYNHYIYYCGQESLRRNGVAIMVNKRVWNAVLGCNLKNDLMISVRFQGKPFNITVIEVYAPTRNAEEVEVEQFYEDLQDLLELTPNQKMPVSS